MEPVAADAAFVEFARQGEALGQRRQGVVEGGIEAGDLRQARAQPRQRTDARQVVRLVQGAQRDQRFHVRQHGRIDPHRMDVAGTAVHHAMTGRAKCQAGVARLQPAQYLPQRLLMVGHGNGLIDRAVRRVKYLEAPVAADLLDAATIDAAPA